MLKELKFKTEKQDIYFWGCTHIFHNPKWPIPIWKMRGYNSVEEHAQAIKDKINNTCKSGDLLFLIGDGFLNSNPEQVEEFLFSLNPKIAYLFGNHESSMTKLYRKYRDYQYGHLIVFNQNDEFYPLNYKNITFYGNYLECWIDNKFCVIQHFPLQVFNFSKAGGYMLHSHNHGGLKSSLPEAQNGRILDCGVDVFPDGPVSFNKIIEIMDKKEIKKFDEHH